MSTAELKYNIFELISSIEDEKRLKVIYQSIKSNSSDWWEELTEEDKASVSEGLTDIKNGKTKSHSEVDMAIEALIKNHA
ncbi:hypothetical protein [Parvicella tangerina]|uniref:Uncharacterized protein n=1 Tax=Parvicella tangerina TaxID=2829795 RepID=A0A916NHB7_9FLAO|nr:hypothetical protein [Parvicella tangerina]CAG5081276.1 hypothetical protein CRYO30217_01580 [Parvicella tangerina]